MLIPILLCVSDFAMKLLSTLFRLITIFNAVRFVDAQYPPRIVDLYEIESPINPKIKIRFKSPDSQICNTTNTSQKQYTGHIVSTITLNSPQTLLIR